jgi:hypothetical protein
MTTEDSKRQRDLEFAKQTLGGVLSADFTLPAEYKESLQGVQKELHSLKPESPRGQVAGAVAEQSTQKLPPHVAYKGTESGEELLAQRNKNTDVVDTNEKPVARGGVAFVPSELPTLGDSGEQATIANLGKQTVANHELEHATNQPERNSVDRMGKEGVAPENDLREIGPAVGDIVFRAEQFEMDEGKPLDLEVELPGGKKHDVKWMQEQARKHGYFDGKSMHDLVFNTEAGRQWAKQMADRKKMAESAAQSQTPQQPVEKPEPVEPPAPIVNTVEEPTQEPVPVPASPVAPPVQPYVPDPADMIKPSEDLKEELQPDKPQEIEIEEVAKSSPPPPREKNWADPLRNRSPRDQQEQFNPSDWADASREAPPQEADSPQVASIAGMAGAGETMINTIVEILSRLAASAINAQQRLDEIEQSLEGSYDLDEFGGN